MKRIIAGLVGGVVFGLMISGAAFASDDERYEHGRARIAMPSYGNAVPTAPVANMSSYPPAVRYYGNEAYDEHSGRYGYHDDDRYEYREGYREHR